MLTRILAVLFPGCLVAWAAPATQPSDLERSFQAIVDSVKLGSKLDQVNQILGTPPCKWNDKEGSTWAHYVAIAARETREVRGYIECKFDAEGRLVFKQVHLKEEIQYITYDQFRSVKSGMYAREVVQILGPPGSENTRQNGEIEAKYFIRTPPSGVFPVIVLLYDPQGQLKQIESRDLPR